MREELFKAKRKDNDEWIQGSLLVLDDGSCRIATSCLVGNVENVLTVCAYDVDPDTVCRYIGLTDKNGNEIWENDVVKKHFYTDYDAYANSEEYTGKVEYLDFAWCITFEEDKHKCVYPIFMAVEFKDAEYYEVIGNIFDNTELLN